MGMATGYEAVFLLYKELLEVLEKEKEDIAASNLGRLESYCAAKEEIIQRLGQLEKYGFAARNLPPGSGLEAEIKRVLLLHEANTKAVLEIRNRLTSELSGLQTVKSTIKAYNIHAKA